MISWETVLEVRGKRCGCQTREKSTWPPSSQRAWSVVEVRITEPW